MQHDAAMACELGLCGAMKMIASAAKRRSIFWGGMPNS